MGIQILREQQPLEKLGQLPVRYTFCPNRKVTGHATAYLVHLKQEIKEIDSLTQVWGCLRIAGVEEAMATPQFGIQKKNVCTKTRRKMGRLC